jgi:Fic-DOC domain mobile mystery protein B
VPEWDALPGETPIDISHLKVKGVQTRSQLDLIEGANVYKAVSKYFGRRRPTARMAPFTLQWAKRLHREMFGDVWKWAGRNRTSEVNIGVKWHLIDEKLQNLLDDLTCWQESGGDVLEQAVRLHHRAVQIHPFYNGNGRWARMLANIFLRSRGHSVTEWPAQLIGSASVIRNQYLEAIKAADEGDYAPLTHLHRIHTPTPFHSLTLPQSEQRRVPGDEIGPKSAEGVEAELDEKRLLESFGG